MTEDLIAWLLEQVTYDEQTARQTGEFREWTVATHRDHMPLVAAQVLRVGDSSVYESVTAEEYIDRDDAVHIANWDPARALAECKIKKELIEECRIEIETGTDLTSGSRLAKTTLHAWAAVYVAAGRDGYRPEWSDDDDD